MGEVVRLPASTVALQDAVDAFLEHHDVAHSTRRVYRASLGGLAAAFDPGAALATFPVRSWPDGFAPATVPRRRRPGTGSWRPSAPRSAGGRRGWLAGDPTEGLERRRDRPDRTRALTRRQLEAVFVHRDLPMLLARSRHASVGSLERYARPGPEAVAWPRPTRPAADHNPRRPSRLDVAPLWWTPVPATLVFAVIACWLVLSGCRVLAACSPPAPRVLVLTVALIVTFSGRS
jgi:hypothetical protein